MDFKEFLTEQTKFDGTTLVRVGSGYEVAEGVGKYSGEYALLKNKKVVFKSSDVEDFSYELENRDLDVDAFLDKVNR